MNALTADTGHITRRITTISVGVAVILIVLKTFALGASGSVSVMASLADSAFDLLASVATFFAVRWAAASPDAKHRYGHGKAEGLAALVQSGVIMASCFFVGLEALKRIARPVEVTGGAWAIIVILISMALTIWLIWMQSRAIKATGSLAVKGDRAHYTTDLAANAVVIIGLVSGSFLKAPGLDAAAGLIVAIWLAWGAINLMRQAAHHLLDGEAPAQERNTLSALVLADPRISNLHQLRTRMSGQVLQAQMHVDLDPQLSLQQAHQIIVEAEQRILERYPRADILIHADPANVAAHNAKTRTLSEGDDLPATLALNDDIPPPPKGPWG